MDVQENFAETAHWPNVSYFRFFFVEEGSSGTGLFICARTVGICCRIVFSDRCWLEASSPYPHLSGILAAETAWVSVRHHELAKRSTCDASSRSERPRLTRPSWTYRPSPAEGEWRLADNQGPPLCLLRGKRPFSWRGRGYSSTWMDGRTAWEPSSE